ncbi:coilin [Capsicum annuum]|uniref:coilin n=1 Tax=Capsicum annuum TaxID=4072 RepID=UPI0007BF3FF6|nr:coilin [Capsicum annuum]
MERIRLRLTFEDPHILSDLQKSEGLRRSWFLLKPQIHTTISQLSSHILTTFQINHSCPHGILLYMDGFLLPPFESTCILKNRCIVSVKKKGGVLAIEGNDGPKLAENIRIVEKQPVKTGHLPLENKEFDNESGGYDSEDESEDEEVADLVKLTSPHLENSLGCNVISEKRKASETLPSLEKKKHCSEVSEKVDEQTKKSQQDLTSNKSLCKQKKVADPDSNDVDKIKGNAESSKVNDSTSGMKKNDEFQEKGLENVEATTKPERVKKGPSRSARKQYAKRQWLREMIKLYKNVASETEGLTNAGKRAGNLHPKWLVNSETEGRPKGRWNRKQQQSKDKYQEVIGQPKGLESNQIGQPKGLLHWKQSREEAKVRDTNRQGQANEKSTLCEKPEHGDMEDEIVPGQALQQDQVQEIDFPPVPEVHLVKNGNSDSVTGLSGQHSDDDATNKSNPVPNAGEKKTHGPAKENGGVDLWEQHCETMKVENEELQKENSWGTWSSGKQSSWSERALREGACGPTMALRDGARGPTMALRGGARGPRMALRGCGRGPRMAFRRFRK